MSNNRLKDPIHYHAVSYDSVWYNQLPWEWTEFSLTSDRLLCLIGVQHVLFLSDKEHLTANKTVCR